MKFYADSSHKTSRLFLIIEAARLHNEFDMEVRDFRDFLQRHLQARLQFDYLSKCLLCEAQ